MYARAPPGHATRLNVRRGDRRTFRCRPCPELCPAYIFDHGNLMRAERAERSLRAIKLWRVLAIPIVGAALMLDLGAPRELPPADARLSVAICRGDPDEIDSALAGGATLSPTVTPGRWVCPPLQYAVIRGDIAVVR